LLCQHKRKVKAEFFPSLKNDSLAASMTNYKRQFLDQLFSVAGGEVTIT
jgi:hypothetical protein